MRLEEWENKQFMLREKVGISYIKNLIWIGSSVKEIAKRCSEISDMSINQDSIYDFLGYFGFKYKDLLAGRKVMISSLSIKEKMDRILTKYDWDLQKLSYFIGFYLGDGGIDGKNVVYLENTNKSHMEKWHLLMPTSRLRIDKVNKVKHPAWSDNWKVSVINSDFADFLIYDIGIPGRIKGGKTYNVGKYNFGVLEPIHFLRGYFDADGGLDIIKNKSGSRSFELGYVAHLREMLEAVNELIFLIVEERFKIKPLNASWELTCSDPKMLVHLLKGFSSVENAMNRKTQLIQMALDEFKSRVSYGGLGAVKLNEIVKIVKLEKTGPKVAAYFSRMLDCEINNNHVHDRLRSGKRSIVSILKEN